MPLPPWMADLPVEAPNEATLIGAQTVTPFNGSGDWLQGSMDEIRFSNVALTPDKFLDSELRPK